MRERSERPAHQAGAGRWRGKRDGAVATPPGPSLQGPFLAGRRGIDFKKNHLGGGSPMKHCAIAREDGRKTPLWTREDGRKTPLWMLLFLLAAGSQSASAQQAGAALNDTQRH